MSSFAGQVAVITGAASGIGAGLARRASALGMKLVLADIDVAALRRVAEDISGEHLIVPTDVTVEAAVNALADAAWDRFGQVDLVFNNAGVLATGLSWEIPAERWAQVIDVNLRGVVNGVRAFVPRLIAAGRPATMVNTSSVGGFLPSPFMAPYSATKFAVLALTESLAGELAAIKSPVRAALLAPGAVKSEIFRAPPTAASADFHAAMIAMLDQDGLSADDFAGRAFDGLARGDYWLIPQPEILEQALPARTDAILSGRPPAFYGVDHG